MSRQQKSIKIMWSVPLELGESLDGYFLLAHASLVIFTGLALTIPAVLGKNGFLTWYSGRSKERYDPLTTDGEEVFRIAEMELGSHNFVWGLGTLGALIVGCDPQLLCFLQLPAMVSLVFYFSKVNEKLCAVASAIALVICSYFGLQPWPLPAISVEWSPSAIFLALHSVLLILPAFVLFSGKTSGMYEGAQPLTKAFMTREREILIGVQLLGGGLGVVGAVCANGAANFCIIVTPVYFVTGYVHWIGSGEKQNAINNWVVMVLYGCAGILPRLL